MARAGWTPPNEATCVRNLERSTRVTFEQRDPDDPNSDGDAGDEVSKSLQLKTLEAEADPAKHVRKGLVRTKQGARPETDAQKQERLRISQIIQIDEATASEMSDDEPFPEEIYVYQRQASVRLGLRINLYHLANKSNESISACQRIRTYDKDCEEKIPPAAKINLDNTCAGCILGRAELFENGDLLRRAAESLGPNPVPSAKREFTSTRSDSSSSLMSIVPPEIAQVKRSRAK